MFTAALIRKRIQELGAGVIFSTAEFLSFGSRNAVDITLCRLCKAGKVLRLSPGLFVVHLKAAELPALNEIARAKAARFNRTITIQGDHTQRKIANNIFYTNGCRSSFNSIRGRIQFLHISPRNRQEVSSSSSGVNTINSRYANNVYMKNPKAAKRKSQLKNLTNELLEITFRLSKLIRKVNKCCFQSTEKDSRQKPDAAKRSAFMINSVILSDSGSRHEQATSHM